MSDFIVVCVRTESIEALDATSCAEDVLGVKGMCNKVVSMSQTLKGQVVARNEDAAAERVLVGEYP